MKMKLGISVAPFYLFKEEKYKILKDMGFDYGDYNNMATNHYVHTCTPEELIQFAAKEKAEAEAVGFKFSQVHGHWDEPYNDADKEWMIKRFEMMKKSILFAHLIGAKCWVVHPLLPCGKHEKGAPEEERTLEWNVEFFTKLADYAAEYDVTVCLENMPFPEFSVATPKDVLNVINMVNHPNFKACLDTGHAAIFSKANVGNDVRMLGNNLKALHIHDNDGNCDGHWFPTHGIVNWEDMVTALKEIEFSGVFSLETNPVYNGNDDEYLAHTRELANIVKRITL